MGYRGHFERMGFTKTLEQIDALRAKGAPIGEQLDAFPPELLRRVGYFGPAEGAAAAFNDLAQGLDTAVVRVVAARPGLESILAAMRACAPSAVAA